MAAPRLGRRMQLLRYLIRACNVSLCDHCPSRLPGLRGERPAEAPPAWASLPLAAGQKNCSSKLPYNYLRFSVLRVPMCALQCS